MSGKQHVSFQSSANHPPAGTPHHNPTPLVRHSSQLSPDLWKGTVISPIVQMETLRNSVATTESDSAVKGEPQEAGPEIEPDSTALRLGQEWGGSLADL